MDYSIDPEIFKNLKTISLSMFRKNFFGIFHGSLSVKLEEGHFLINKKDHASKISGEAVYVADYPKENLLCGKLLRSSKAKARVLMLTSQEVSYSIVFWASPSWDSPYKINVFRTFLLKLCGFFAILLE